MFSVIPSKFLPDSRSPCWYEEFLGRNTTDPYLTNSYALYSKRFRATFDALRKAFWSRLSHAAGRHFRLRCLPRFYIDGQPKCGTTDLYDRLRLHPEVKFSAIKEPHWWTRKRFGAWARRPGCGRGAGRGPVGGVTRAPPSPSLLVLRSPFCSLRSLRLGGRGSLLRPGAVWAPGGETENPQGHTAQIDPVRGLRPMSSGLEPSCPPPRGLFLSASSVQGKGRVQNGQLLLS